jgi:hypothetical protein
MNDQTKVAVTISMMASMCSLSRSRFNQLIGTAFPYPLYSVATRRPFYDEELQKVCLEVRRRNCGADGKPVLFYAKQHSQAPRLTPKRKPVAKPKPQPHDDGLMDILEGVRSLGLSMTTYSQVEAAVKTAFPNGTSGISPGEVIRAVFLGLQRQDR